MFTVLGIAIPAGLFLVGAKYVPMWLNDLKDKAYDSKEEKKSDSS